MRPVQPTENAAPATSGGECGDLVVSYLRQIGVEYVFGVPGGAIEPLMNALARGMRQGGPRAIVARHESGAAFMADGYARETGRLGVCFATTGPGATNLLTGVANAHQNKVPLLAITAQTKLETFGRGGMQESSGLHVDTVGMFAQCTRMSTLVSHPAQVEHKLISAVLGAFREPYRAVHLSIPTDVLRAPAPSQTPKIDLSRMLDARELTDEYALLRLTHELAAARKVVFVVGEGAHEAIGWVLSLALRLRALVVTTPHGKGLVSPYHPQFRGVFGFSGHTSALAALADREVDLVLSVGCSFGEWATGSWDEHALLNERLVCVDSDPENFAAAPQARLHVRGGLNMIFRRLHETLLAREEPIAPSAQRAGKPWLTLAYARPQSSGEPPEPAPNCMLDEPRKYTEDSTPIKPQRVLHDLPNLLPPGTRYLADGNSAVFWAIHYLHLPDRRVSERRAASERREAGPSSGAERRLDSRRTVERRRAWSGLFRGSMEFTCMGWAIGGAVGTAFGNPNVPVVCLTGDGSILMNGQEMTVAAQHGLNVLFVVFNDASLGTIKHGQRLSGAEPIGTELPQINFADFARTLGVPGHVVQSPADLQALDWAAICTRGGPTLLDVRIDPDEVPPLGARLKGLQSLP